MGMDLYHYKFTSTEQDRYDIGKKYIKLKDIQTLSVLEPDSDFVDKCIDSALGKYGIPYQQSQGTFCHDFTDENYYVAIYNDATILEFQRLGRIIDSTYDNDDFDSNTNTEKRNKAYKDYNDFGIKVADDESYWAEKIEFSPIPLITTYKIVGAHKEIGYCRKPFRSISDKNMDTYRKIMDNANGDPESAFVIFDSKTEKDFKQLIGMIECSDIKEHLTAMLPIKDDELICIDW